MAIINGTHRLTALAALLLSLCLVPTAIAQADRFDVSGVVTDTTDAGLGGATVVVLQPADSTLVSFGITRGDGAFRITRVPAGDHLLQITFVGYGQHTQPISIADGHLDVGRIALRESVADLGELVVTAAHVPMVIKRDTIEYNAAAFRVGPNANVEELLRRLPGIEVDRDGSITAQGEQVRQVLVDGREFFGNDPTVATRNLPAEAVDRVQVYDRRSDAAEFTGVDDGQEQRTINLALRPERRQGYFGNASGGVGDVQRYEGRASLHRFSPETQLSFIGTANNVNQQGFNIQDYVRFMGGAQALMSEGGGISFGDAPISSGLSDGFSTTFSGGLNFNREFSPRTSLRASYMGYYLDHEQDRNVLQREIAGLSAAALTQQQADQLSRQHSHRLNLNLHHTFSEGHDVRLRSNVGLATSDLESWVDRETRGAGDQLENTNVTNLTTTSETLRADARLTYRKRFSPGRSLVAELRSGLTDSDMSGELAALSQFYLDGNVLTSEELAQLQAQLGNTFTHGQRLTYTEPLGRRALLQLDLEHRAVQEDQDRSVFDLGGDEPLLNPGLSSGFERTFRYYRAGLNFRRAVEPLTIRFGVDAQQSRLDGTIHQAGAAVDRTYFHVLPSATLGYAFSRTRNVELRYNTTTREPSMRDLQPFADNSDPLNVYVGNPDLRPEYTHSLMLRFMFFDPFSSTSIFAWTRAAYTLDKIARVRTIDEHLRQTVTPINADGDWSISGNVSFGRPIRPLRIQFNASSQTVFNRGIEFINGESNTTDILRSTVELRVENRNKDLVDARVGARYTFNDVRYALNPGLSRSYVNRTYFGDVAIDFAEGWRARAQLDYAMYSRDVFGTARNVPLLHAEISKMLMNDRVQLSLEARDLLDESVGVNFSNTSTYIQEERIHSLGRYVMLRLTYNIAGASRQPGSIMRMGG